MPYKIEKLCRKIQKDISEIIRTEMNDPRMGFVSVTRVELTKDLKFAKVWVSILGDETEQSKVMRGLDHAKGFIQGGVARRLQTRQTPILTFQHDRGIEQSIKISQLLKDIVPEEEEEETTDDPGTSPS